MSAQNGVPEVSFVERDDSQSVQDAAANIGAMLGVTQRGIPNVRKRVRGWKDFVRAFGSYLAASVSDLAFAAKRALDGGAALDIVRIVHLDGSGNSTAVAAFKTLQTSGGGATAASVVGTVVGSLVNSVRTWLFANGNTLTVKVDGGSNLTTTLSGTQATKALTNAATFTLADLQTVKYRVGAATEPEQTLTFATADFSNIAAATVQEVFNVLARDLVGVRPSKVSNVITLKTDQIGSGARLEFTGGTALTALGLVVEVKVGTGNVADLLHVTVAELNTLVLAATTNTVGVTADGSGHAVFTHATTGSGHSIQFVNGGAADAAGIAALGIPDTSVHSGTSNSAVDTLKFTAAQNGVADPGTWANGTSGLSVSSANATMNPSTRFKITIKQAGVVVSTEDELSLDPADARYVVAVFANHPFVMATDLDAYGVGGLGSYTTARPAVQTDQTMSGGDDGLTGLVAADYQGDSVKKTGFYALDSDKDASFAMMPGYRDRATQAALVSYCAARGDMLAVLELPPGLTPSQIGDWRMGLNAYTGQGGAFNSSFGAAYDNRIKITDPTTKAARFISPLGDIAGLYAKSKIGAQFTPAGPVAGPQGGLLPVGTPAALGLEKDVDLDTDGATILGFGVNPIIDHPKYGLVVWGEKNLASTPSDLDRVPQRRWVIYAIQSLKPVVEPVVLFQPNDAIAWAATGHIVRPWLRKEIALRAISDARWVNDASVNTALDIAQHKQNPQLLVKHNLHAEFIGVTIVAVAQTTQLAS